MHLLPWATLRSDSEHVISGLLSCGTTKLPRYGPYRGNRPQEGLRGGEEGFTHDQLSAVHIYTVTQHLAAE